MDENTNANPVADDAVKTDAAATPATDAPTEEKTEEAAA